MRARLAADVWKRVPNCTSGRVPAAGRGVLDLADGPQRVAQRLTSEEGARWWSSASEPAIELEEVEEVVLLGLASCCSSSQRGSRGHLPERCAAGGRADGGGSASAEG